MADKVVFVPKSEGKIPFGGSELTKVQLEDNMGYIVVDSLAAAFSIDRRSLQQRLSRSKTLYGPYTVSVRAQTPGGPQAKVCLAAVAVPAFLEGVDLDRIEDATGRELLRLFQVECMDVLAEHFGISERDEMRVMRRQLAEMEMHHQVRHDNPDISAGEELKKVRAEMAEMERAHQEKVEQMRQAFANLRDQIKDYNRVAGDECITVEQQGEVYLAVETLGKMLEEEGEPKAYASIYMDIAHISGVASYKQIPKKRYQAVMDHLHRRIQAHSPRQQDEGPSI